MEEAKAMVLANKPKEEKKKENLKSFDIDDLDEDNGIYYSK